MSGLKRSVAAQTGGESNYEVRVIRALYSQECLGEHIQPSSSACISDSQRPPPLYHNTGVQTLPPPNGDVFELIHGREPSTTDYVRNAGVAAVGRFKEDPRSNPCELIYGAAYLAPTVTQTKTYVHTGFQTAKCSTTRMALAKAKVKASVMAAKYREAALRAGYAVCAESRDEVIVHSEQFSSVRLDGEGNLLEGTIAGRYLPNIRGTSTSLQPQPPVTGEAPTITVKPSSPLAKRDSQAEVMYPVKNFLPLPSLTFTSKNSLYKPPTTMSALAPAPTEQVPNLELYSDNEYGSGESCTNEYIIYDPGDTSRTPAATVITTPLPLKRKRRVEQEQHSSTSTKRYKGSLQDVPEEDSTCAAPGSRPPSHTLKEHSSRRCPSSRSDHRSLSGSLQRVRTLASNTRQTRTLTVDKVSTTDMLKSNAVRSDDELVPSVKVSRCNICVDDAGVSKEGQLKKKMLQPTISGSPEHGQQSVNADEILTSRGVQREQIGDTKTTMTKRKRTGSSMSTHNGDGKPETKRVKFSLKLHASRKDNHKEEFPNVVTGEDGNVLQRHGVALHGRSTKPTPSATNDRDRNTLGFVEEGIKPRASKSSRCLFTPYVPPAMRAKAGQFCKDVNKQQQAGQK
ncbi:hypothetical protein OPT61_g8815 [Boeremia exigua]|uniref:Uncharacterized protein n=1 Tax=Boeremia exigua TaxID=749465 RepID=A0ACC2HWM8_9PLEO|nr:hypothetical protein OPT61_g8815 [Boeremia exigua]